MNHSPPLFQVKQLSKQFAVGKDRLLKAIDDVSFEIYPGETLGLVGESGCGKSTTGRSLLRLDEPTSGQVLFEGEDLYAFSPKKLKVFRRYAQIIFQDPYSSLNPRMTAEEIIAEPLLIHQIGDKKQRRQKVEDLLQCVGLSSNVMERYPHEFSGGQRQRVGIARALALSPRFIVCDEPISALDVSVQAQIVNLLKQLQKERQLTYLFIAHDLAMVKYLSTRVAVMYLGQIVELAPSAELYAQPLHPYTEALLSAIPIPDPIIEKKRTRIVLQGDVPSPINTSPGCPFVNRCPYAKDVCKTVRPPLKEVQPAHFAACHLLT
jgi:oligopeptide/dipeptide ABC transporter ATP-binding protein